MSNLTDAVGRLTAILTPPIGGTNETKIFEPEPDDPNAGLKQRLIGQAEKAISLGHAAIDGQAMSVPLVENEMFMELDQLPENDAEKQDYFELVNATQAVLIAVNGPAA
jgi:hypothetical protein